MLAKRKSEPLQQYSRVVGINVAHGSFRSTSTQTTMGATFLNQQGGTPSLLSVGAEAPTDNRAGVPPLLAPKREREISSVKRTQKKSRIGATSKVSLPPSRKPPLSSPTAFPASSSSFPTWDGKKYYLLSHQPESGWCGLQVILFRH